MRVYRCRVGVGFVLALAHVVLVLVGVVQGYECGIRWWYLATHTGVGVVCTSFIGIGEYEYK